MNKPVSLIGNLETLTVVVTRADGSDFVINAKIVNEKGLKRVIVSTG